MKATEYNAIYCIVSSVFCVSQVLALAPSNIAVDNLGVRLHQAGVRVIRIGPRSRVSPCAAHITLDARVDFE